MATANELLIDACASGIACLDKRNLLVAWAQAKNPNGTANELLQAACADGLACLNKRELLIVTAQALNP